MAALASAALGSSTGAFPGTTGAPGAEGAEPTCAACHSGAESTSASAALALEGLPERYEPGRRYSLHLSLAGAEFAQSFGFQLTALATASLRGAGELVVTDPARTQRSNAIDDERQYLGHTLAGTTSGAHWSFDWIAPASDAGPVAFFAAANAADRDGSPRGDHVYTRSPQPLATLAGPLGAKETR